MTNKTTNLMFAIVSKDTAGQTIQLFKTEEQAREFLGELDKTFDKTASWKKELEENYFEYTKHSGVLVEYIGKNGIDIDDFICQELTREYKKGFNDCLKEQGLTGEENQHLYL